MADEDASEATLSDVLPSTSSLCGDDELKYYYYCYAKKQLATGTHFARTAHELTIRLS